MAYLQFDGVTNDANSHRKVGNLFDVKLRAIENLHRAGIDVILVVTIVNGINNDQVGPIVDFAIANADKVTVVSFQPVSFTGRDEDIDDETRKEAEAYHAQPPRTRCEGADGSHRASPRLVPPLCHGGSFSDLTDTLLGERADWGSLKCGCHPNCGLGTVLFVHKKTKQMVPLTEFLDLDGLLEDVQEITDAAQGRAVTLAEVGLALLKRFDPAKALGFTFRKLVSQFLRPDRRERKEDRRVRGAIHPSSSGARCSWPGNVVPGPLQLRLPAHGDVHHPVRNVQMGEISFLRVQHRRGLAERHRKDEGQRDGGGVVPA